MKTKQSSAPRPGGLIPIKSLALTAGLIASAATVFAQSFYTNSTGDFNVPASWSPNGVPTGNAANDNGSNNVVLIQVADPIWAHGDTLAGQTDGSSGAYLQTGSTNNTGGGNWLRMGIGLNTYGKYVLSNGWVNVGGRLQIGERGTGYLEISGGTMRANANDGGANPGLVAGDGNFAGVSNNLPVGTVVLNSGTLNIGNGEVWFGNGNNDIGSRGTGHLIMHGGTFNVNNWFVFGRFGAAGDGYMDGGVINKNNNGNVQIGVGTMNGGTIPAQAYFRQTGGTFNCASQYQIGTDSTASSVTNDVGGNAILIVDNWLAIGRNGATGVLNISNNAAITKTGVNGGNVTIGTGAAGNGTVNQYGGTFTNTATSTYLTESGTATWNMYAGQAILGTVVMGNDNAGTPTINLNGGLFRATSISAPHSTVFSTLNFNGGTLQAGGDNVNFVANLTLAFVQAGGAVIDSQGFNITIPQSLNDFGGGGLTKLGSGSLTLAGANNYAGATVVSAGTLATTTDSTGGGAYTVANGATLGVTVRNAGAQLNMDSAALASSTAATLNLDLGIFGNPGPSSAPINVANTLAVNGAITINIADDLPQLGQFPLIKYGSRTGSGSFALGSLPVGVVATLSNNVASKSVDLVITAVDQPRWDGQAGGTWDLGADTNWVNIGTGLPTTYSDPNPVLFNDSALGTTTVNLTTTVNPKNVTVNNNFLPYAIGGSGKISGTTGLNKTGDGSLVITNSGGNNYTGKTTISGGSLTVTSLANGGSPSAIGASSASPTNLVLSGGTLVYAGAPVTINRGYSLQGINTNSGIDTESNLTLSGLVTAGMGDGFVKTGPAQLAYTTVGSNNLSSAHYEVQAGSVLLNGSAGGQTNFIAGHIAVNNPVDASLTLTNTTLNVTDFNLANQPNMYGSAVIENGTVINNSSWFILGDGANGVANLTMNGGTVNVPNGRFFLCSAPGTTATFTMNGGTLNKAGDYFAIVNAGWNGQGARTGIVNQVNGTINCQSECWIGDTGGTNHDSLGVYNLSGGTLTLGSWFGVGRDGASGVFNMSGGTLNKAGGGDMVIGRGGSSGLFTMTGGTLNKDPGNPIIVGQGGGVGQFNMSGGVLTSGAEYWLGLDSATLATNNISGTAQVNIHNWVTVGRNGLGVVNMSAGNFFADMQPFIVGIWNNSKGYWNQSGGALYVNHDIWIGQGDTNAYGTLSLSGGTITNTGWLALGREGAHGTLNISGGSMVTVGAGNISIAHNAGSSGDVIISGTGSYTCTTGQAYIGENGGPGTWTMNGGSAVLGVVHLAQHADATGVLTLNGGSLTATEISTGDVGSPLRQLNFNSGVLVAGADNATFIHDLTAANVQAGGAVINSGGHNIGINQSLLDAGGGGGLTKLGLGTLSLNGINTYTGPTLVNAGTLGGSGVIQGSVTVAGVAALAPGNGLGVLTVNSNVTLGGNTIMEVSRNGGVPASDLLAVTGALTYGGTLTVVVNSTNALNFNDTFNLFDWGTRSGTFSSIILPGNYYWDTSQLNVNGTIRVIGIVPPKVNPAVVVGGNMVLTGVGGPPGAGYTWLTSTNVAAPLATWTTNSTGVFDANGTFSNAFPINPSVPARFYELRTP
jgi:autotransporter-associated beta strand protein/T5SS/PEP-CTERM-associated repeat protein